MSDEARTQQLHQSRLSARIALAAVLLSGSVTLFPGVAQAQSVATAERTDAQIQKDVASTLANSGALKGQQITAAAVEGEVTISGNVRDEASKELAESLIGRVSGVKSVSNNLVVGSASASSQSPADPALAAQNTPGVTQAAGQNAEPAEDVDPAVQNMAPVGSEEPAEAQSAPAPPPQPSASVSTQSYPQQQASAPPAQLYPVTIPAGTLLQIRTSEPLDASRTQPGQIFSATVAADVFEGNILAIPRGAAISGRVEGTTTNKGDLAGKQGLSLVLTSINLGGQAYPLPTDTWAGHGPGKGGYSAGNTIGGAGIGAVIGAIAGGGAGAAIGAGVGGLAGAGASAATTGPRLYIPAEAVLNFHLTAPVTVTPPSAQEAQRLASNSAPRQPQLRQRYAYGYPYGYPPPPPPPPYYYGYRYPVAYYPYYYYRRY